ncbi:MAG: ligase-associated DNA damage response DEXH box helicase, partial [Bacteroidota bacterium]
MPIRKTNKTGFPQIDNWFRQKGWQPFAFQKECWEHYLQGKSGLLNAPTGSGKTYALWVPCLMEYIQEFEDEWQKPRKNGLRILWITPLRALTKDIHRAMEELVIELGLSWRVAFRTGDTSASERQKQKRNSPECLITTPESLHLMLAQKNYSDFFKSLNTVIVDEWHELLGSKRGVQIELALSRLRAIRPKLKTWGISATIGNLEEAADILIGRESVIVRSELKKKIEVVSILPDAVEKFPWAGHLGTNLIEKIIPIIEASNSTLIFTNTRAQTETWYQKLMEVAPQFAGAAAMHHGSLDREIRDWVESAIHEGKLKVVVCTSSLDLGVDFRPVETVIQVGGPKGVGRFMQRAGRSGHQPDALSRIYFLPTHSLELIEGAALRQAVQEVAEQNNIRHMESRNPISKPIDVLVQYLVTLAVSDGFTPKVIFEEIKKTFAYKDLDKEEWYWCLQFITSGGESLGAYEEFNKVLIENGIYKILSRKIAMQHRMSMGTIVSEPLVKIKYISGGYIGTVEEIFVSRLKSGDSFWFAGKSLLFVKMDRMTALVRRSKKKTGLVPRWLGARLPLSSELSQLIRTKLDGNKTAKDVELIKIQPILKLQQSWSIIPKKNELLIEYTKSGEGFHLFIYPFEGRMIHEIMAALISYRISQLTPISFSFAMNDYGFELLADKPIPLQHALELDLFTTENLLFDIEQSINKTEMAKRRFREIAVISGLIFQGYPGKNKAGKHLQASSELLFKVFSEYDSDNLLIRQAFNEVIDSQLEKGRLINVLKKIR